MLKNVYVRGVGGQKWAKFCLRSFWTTPEENLIPLQVPIVILTKFCKLYSFVTIYIPFFLYPIQVVWSSETSITMKGCEHDFAVFSSTVNNGVYFIRNDL